MSHSTPGGPSELTRMALMEAALVVFGRKGYAATSLEEVALEARVTRGALYQHFRSKPELYVAAIDQRWVEVSAPIRLQLRGEEAPLERLRRFVSTYLTALEEDARLRAMLEITHLRAEHLPELNVGVDLMRDAMSQWAEQLTDLFESAKRRGELPERTHPRTAALAVMALVSGITSTWLLSPELVSPARDAEQMTHLLLHGILG